jgi:peptidoglycan/LPS O-acetylase OafA/YrhL
VLGYLSESSYPFYILHQTVIVIVGYLVVQTDLPLGLTFASIAVIATLVTFGLYEGLIRHWNPVRALFGMSPRRTQMWTRSMGSEGRPARSSAQARSGTSSQFLINQ